MVSYRAVDLFIRGRGLDFEFARRYDSHNSDVTGPLGYGWDHSYNIRLEIQQSGTYVDLYNGNQRIDSYVERLPSGSGLYDCPGGVYTLLKRDPSTNTFILRNREGTRTTFTNIGNVTGRLKSIQDRNGNKLSFYHDPGSGDLDYVIDTLGRLVDFQHDAQGRLQWIQDYRGRRLEYYYDADGNLGGVRTPTVTSTGGLNDFPDGRTEAYDYYRGYGNLIDHMLKAVIKPRDVTQQTPPYGTPAVQFVYDTNPNSWYFGWCVSQTLGGNNGQGAAGGTISYSYTTLDLSPPTVPNALLVERLQCRVVDRRSQVTDYYFNQNSHALRVVEFDGPTAYTTTNTYNAAGELTLTTRPNGTSRQMTYQANVNPMTDGNLVSMTQSAGNIPTDQTSRTVGYQYEPFFNEVISYTAYRGYETVRYCDYQEGIYSVSPPNSLITALQSELLGYYSADDVYFMITNQNLPFRDEDLNGDGNTTSIKGNVVQTVYPGLSINTVGGAPWQSLTGLPYAGAEILETRTYNAYGQVTSETDPEENVKVFLYHPATDPDGDGVPTFPSTGLDQVTGGYLRRVVEDTTLPFADPQLNGVGPRAQQGDFGRDSGQNPTPANKKTDYKYDPSGNLLTMTDPRGVRHDFAVTELNETWKVTRAADVSAAPTRGGGINGANENLAGQAFAYIQLSKYDANGNRTTRLVQNAGGQSDGGLSAGFWETYWTYDILNCVRTETKEYGFAGEQAIWSFGYDANENETSVTQPEGNLCVYTYDFRDRVKTITRGAYTSDASVVTFDRDANGILEGYKDGRGFDTIIDIDGFDRPKRVVSPVGAEKKMTYDAGDNVTVVSQWGHTTWPAPTGNNTSGNLELRRETFAYDAMGWLTQIDRVDPRTALLDGSLTPADGKVTTVYNYDRLGRRIYAIDDDGTKTETLVDGASRVYKVTDPVGNVVERSYDDNDNKVKVIERDIDPAPPFRSFETYRVYDSLNRVRSTTNNVGETSRYTYESRGHVVASSDAVASLSSGYINGRQVNNPGNTHSYVYDGLDRLVSEVDDLRVGGTGDGPIDTSNPYNSDGRVTGSYTWDKNSRMRFATDDKSKTTEYQYDTLDRAVTTIYADATSGSQEYDDNDNVVAWDDANNTHVDMVYDGADRLISTSATPGAGVVGTTQQRFEYDGLGRRTKSTDSVDNLLNNGNDWVSTYAWDALDRCKTNVQNGRTVTTTWREEAKKTQVAYSSGVSVTNVYDALERITSVTQSVQLATYQYAGRSRLLAKTDYAGVVERYHDGTWDDTAYYDGARRPTKVEFMKGAAQLTGLEHDFDRAGNRLYARRLHDSSRGDNYVYDSLYRLVALERDVTAASVGYPGGDDYEIRRRYDFDGVHNRRKTYRSTDPSMETPTTYSVSAVHNYTTKTTGALPPYTVVTQTFDANGNKTAFATGGIQAAYSYDFLNRLRIIQKGSQRVDMDYDGEGRRVRTKTQGFSSFPVHTEFIHDGHNVIEELDASGSPLRRYYYGDELDELLGYENLAFFPNTGAYFYERDSHGDVVAIHDMAGTVKERYVYSAFGSLEFQDANSVKKSIAASDFGNPRALQGLHYENYFHELYYCRARYLDVTDGNFLQRDPLGYWADSFNLGNAKTYCAQNSINYWDPMGTKVFLVVRDMIGFAHRPLGAVGASHMSIVVTKGDNNVRATDKDGRDLGPHADNGSYAVTPEKGSRALGEAKVRKDSTLDQGNRVEGDASSKDEHYSEKELEAPEGVDQDIWEESVKEVGDQMMQELGESAGSPGNEDHTDKDGTYEESYFEHTCIDFIKTLDTRAQDRARVKQRERNAKAASKSK
jgi:RHS repeat-associated protein